MTQHWNLSRASLSMKEIYKFFFKCAKISTRLHGGTSQKTQKTLIFWSHPRENLNCMTL